MRIDRNVIYLAVGLAGAAAAAQDTPRVVISRVGPAYPQIARQIHIAGPVQVRVQVLPSGDVAAARTIAGHPLLAEEAERCARKWRFMPGSRTSTFVVEVLFDLND